MTDYTTIRSYTAASTSTASKPIDWTTLLKGFMKEVMKKWSKANYESRSLKLFKFLIKVMKIPEIYRWTQILKRNELIGVVINKIGYRNLVYIFFKLQNIMDKDFVTGVWKSIVAKKLLTMEQIEIIKYIYGRIRLYIFSNITQLINLRNNTKNSLETDPNNNQLKYLKEIIHSWM